MEIQCFGIKVEARKMGTGDPGTVDMEGPEEGFDVLEHSGVCGKTSMCVNGHGAGHSYPSAVGS